MALIKEYITEQGFSASYWKVEYISIDKNRKEGSFTLNLYLNKEKGSEVDTFIKSETITLFESELSQETPMMSLVFDKYFGLDTEYKDIYEACYECAKEISPFFADATNC